MSDDIPGLLRDALRALDAAAVEYALIDGCARNAYAEVRSTKDVDFVVAVDAQRYETLVRTLEASGFRRGTAVGARKGAVPDLELFRDARGRRLDLLYAHTEFERAALARREQREPYAGIDVPVVSPEDLIVYKVIAGRPQDRLDVLALVAALAPTTRELDWAYVERWCAAWDVSETLARVRADLAEA